MATYQDLLDAIARVRAATGDRDAWRSGLSGDDIAAACSVLSSPSALGGVLTKIVAGHPEAFRSGAGSGGAPPTVNAGAAADAIRGAETALAQQNSTAAQIDLQVVTAVLNAHVTNAEGAAQLERLQRDVETAVLSRTNLDSPAGARDFQRFLGAKIRDIRTVVDTAGLDATSKAALAAALASLYASVTPPPAQGDSAQGDSAQGEQGDRSPEVQPAQDHSPSDDEQPGPATPATFELPPDLSEFSEVTPYLTEAQPADEITAIPPPVIPQPAAAPIPAPAMTVPAMAPAGPAWGGGLPVGSGGGPSGLSTGTLPDFPTPDLSGPDPLPDRILDPPDEWDPPDELDGAVEDGTDDPGDESPPEDLTAVQLPDGTTVDAPSPEVAAAMTAAVAGTPIAEAFRQQGIIVPAPGSAVLAPIDPDQIVPGDIAVLADRHALALGTGRALLDGRIQTIADVTLPGFLGWLHPSVPGPPTTMESSTPQTPEAPAPVRPPAQTAPS